MINFDDSIVKAATIEGAWREVMQLCVARGYDFLVQGGSYQGQIRKQLEHVTVVINQPWTRPLAPILPPGIPAPTNDDKITEYFLRYLFSPDKTENEVYTYGEFIYAQFERVLSLLIYSKGNTNQATIAIGNSGTTFLDDPPCLRSISWKVVGEELNMTVYFRSWDLYAGFPENLGGLQLLNEFMAHSLSSHFPVNLGKLICFSDGLHLYEQYFPLSDMLNVEKIQVAPIAQLGKIAFEKRNGV